MDILYTSFLQQLVQASNSLKHNDEVNEKKHLALLAFLSKMVLSMENLFGEFNRQDIAQHTAKGRA